MENAPESTASDNILLSGMGSSQPVQDAVTPDEQGQAQPQEISNDWRSAFDEDTNGYIDNKAWKSPADLLQSYQNLEKLKGGNADELYRITADMDDDSRNSIYNALGRPEDVTGYTYQATETDSPELVDALKQTAHKYGFTDKQVTGLLNEMNPVIESMAGENAKAIQSKNIDGLTALQDEWAGSWDSKVNVATRAAEHFGITEEIQKAIVDSGHSAEFLKSLNKIGSLMAEGQMVGMSATDQKASIGAMSKSEAQNEIARLHGDPEFKARLSSNDRQIADQASKELEKYYNILSNR